VQQLHARFEALGSEYDDYIWIPKANGYRSIHTTLLTAGYRWVEVQVRTQEMHVSAQEGDAAHASYKRAIGKTAASPDGIGCRDGNAFTRLCSI